MPRHPKTSITCPLCRERIGIAAGIKAPTPFTMRCPQCRVWLRVRMPGMFLYVSAILLLSALCFLSIPLAQAAFGTVWRSLYMLLMLGLWLMVEVATCVLFFTYATFTPLRIRLRLWR